MATKKITIPLKKALLDLESQDEKKMDKAIQTIASSGNIAVLDELINLLKQAENKQLKKKLIVLFSDIRDEDAKEVIISKLNDDSFEEVKNDLLNVVWNSKLDFSEFIADFVSLSLQGDFMRSIECLTVIENMSGPFEEHHLLEAQLYLKEYYSTQNLEKSQKDEIIGDIAIFIRDQNEGIDADLLLE